MVARKTRRSSGSSRGSQRPRVQAHAGLGECAACRAARARPWVLLGAGPGGVAPALIARPLHDVDDARRPVRSGARRSHCPGGCALSRLHELGDGAPIRRNDRACRTPGLRARPGRTSRTGTARGRHQRGRAAGDLAPVVEVPGEHHRAGRAPELRGRRRRGPSPTIHSRAAIPRARTARSVSTATSGSFSRESRPTHTSRISRRRRSGRPNARRAGTEDFEVDAERDRRRCSSLRCA